LHGRKGGLVRDSIADSKEVRNKRLWRLNKPRIFEIITYFGFVLAGAQF